MFKRALVSVSDKAGLVEFLQPLVQQGMQIVSTGGTKEHLKSHGIPVIDVSEQTGFPEVMDGRVKTLHPRIHMALLARQEVDSDFELLKKENLEAFDLVVVNLYPFEETLKILQNAPTGFTGMTPALIEKIDVGGPSMLRAAAKNFSRIAVVTEPSDYNWILSKQADLTLQDRKKLAMKVFQHTAKYDALIAESFHAENLKSDSQTGAETETTDSRSQYSKTISSSVIPSAVLSLEDISSLNRDLGSYLSATSVHQELRYGENPHQKSVWLKSLNPFIIGWQHADIIQGKALSYNNLLDLEAAFDLVTQFHEPCCVAVKHNNPCGVATADQIHTAVSQACESDSVSVFGGIIAINKPVDEVTAQYLSKIFLECIVAPSYSPEALAVFEKKKNLRILSAEKLFQKIKIANSKTTHPLGVELKSIQGGFLLQQKDNFPNEILAEDFSKIPSQIQTDILFGEKVVASLKSNAIAIVSSNPHGNELPSYQQTSDQVKGSVTVGLGMGQVNRVDSVKLAIERMQKFFPKVKDPVLVSDAFFPFPDSVELIAKAGIRWIVQPGGSVKDDEVLQKAQELNVHMLLTKTRHFKH